MEEDAGAALNESYLIAIQQAKIYEEQNTQQQQQKVL
jgi:hypothetical protein